MGFRKMRILLALCNYLAGYGAYSLTERSQLRNQSSYPRRRVFSYFLLDSRLRGKDKINDTIIIHKPCWVVTALFTIFFGWSSIALAENPWQARYEAQEAAKTPQPPVAATTNGAEILPQAPTEAVEAYNITYGQLKDYLARELEKKGAAASVRVTLPRRDADSVVSFREPLTMEAAPLTFNASLKTWQATLYFSAGTKTLAPMKLSGRYDEMVDVPMLLKRMSEQQTIKQEDITIRSLPMARVRSGTIFSSSQLIGKSPRRAISALRPIREAEITNPTVIFKGKSVTLLFRTPAMEIKTLGEALENGAIGDRIKFRNAESHAILQATILSESVAQTNPEVAMPPSPPLAAAPSPLPVVAAPAEPTLLPPTIPNTGTPTETPHL
jgi:flagella basal body P-ring formation protein FlgA